MGVIVCCRRSFSKVKFTSAERSRLNLKEEKPRTIGFGLGSCPSERKVTIPTLFREERERRVGHPRIRPPVGLAKAALDIGDVVFLEEADGGDASGSGIQAELRVP
jgi:hypothetical protein